MKIRKVEIDNFRGIKKVSWCPSEGINCLIGPGDSCKSTILDAIDYCLGARRSVQFTDADFYKLDVNMAIKITLTLGDLDDELKNFDVYGLYLRSFDSETGEVDDEPVNGLETVLSYNLTVESDLEPVWSLASERAEAQGLKRNLAWKDRIRLAPARIGALASYNLGWSRGSVLNRLTDEKADSSAALAGAARQAREAFGVDAEVQLQETLQMVTEAAGELGVDIGEKAKALLDVHSVNFSGGTVSLHSEEGVPLKGLGVGSTRLLIAGLQRKVSERSSLLLVDEVEYGLEPHRIIRFLGSLGAKDATPPFQVFMTTHSPIVLRELSGNQLVVLRKGHEKHEALPVGSYDSIQGTIRCLPDAFLATSVLVCEGASEVGLIRGIDLYEQQAGKRSIFAHGTSLVDAGGVTNTPDRALAFQRLGYRVCVFRDDDRQPDLDKEQAFTDAGGEIVKWEEGEKLEGALFKGLSGKAVAQLVDKAISLHSEDLVNQHLQSKSQNQVELDDIPETSEDAVVSVEHRVLLANASSGNNKPWFKNISAMEEVGRDIVGPELRRSDRGLREKINGLLEWCRDD